MFYTLFNNERTEFWKIPFSDVFSKGTTDHQKSLRHVGKPSRGLWEHRTGDDER